MSKVKINLVTRVLICVLSITICSICYAIPLTIKCSRAEKEVKWKLIPGKEGFKSRVTTYGIRVPEITELVTDWDAYEIKYHVGGSAGGVFGPSIPVACLADKDKADFLDTQLLPHGTHIGHIFPVRGFLPGHGPSFECDQNLVIRMDGPLGEPGTYTYEGEFERTPVK